MEQKRTAREYLKELFRSSADEMTSSLITIRNVRNIYTVSLIVCIIDLLTLALYFATNWSSPRFRQTVIYVGICVIACAIAIVLSRRIIKKYRGGVSVSNRAANILVMFFYIVMSAWSIMVDVTHYSLEEQVLIFYIVQFCFLCFVVMPPKTGSILIAASFLALYIGLYNVDGAARMQPQNYLIFAVIAVLGNAIQHMTLRESERSKINILELNQILQQEASVDDLTKLKNRKALRSDFSKSVGKNVYVIMADIDSFKSYNDTYGHVAGDKMLRKVAAATKDAFSAGDTYRYGGDELLIILAECTDEKFVEMVGRWKEAIRAIQIPGMSGVVSCSFGYERSMMKTVDDLRAAIKAADDRLYEAKKQNTTDDGDWQKPALQ